MSSIVTQKKQIPFLDLILHDKSIRARIDATLLSLIDTASYIGGDPVNRFAAEFSAFCGGGPCVPVANGTDALILALKALGIGPGDEVITVPFTFIATTEAISAVGATVKFVDIHPKNFTIDVAQLAQVVTTNTKAVLPVHLFGHPADMDPILDLAKKYQLKIVEDAAQAHGALYKGKRVGSFGDIAAFSFYPTKNLGCFGDGGAVVCRTEALAAKVTQLANHGRSAQYFHEIEGLNSRLDTFQAAILRIFLERLDASNERRRAIAKIYDDELARCSFLTTPTIESTAQSVYHLYSIQSDHRDALMAWLKEHGIGCGVYYPLPLHLQPAYKHLGLHKGSFPVSERLSERILALPMYAGMTDEMAMDVCAVVKKFLPK